MRSTGIVRRVDDLGRIVIPKEVRRTLRILEGQPMEILVDIKEGSVIFQKYAYKDNARTAIQSTIDYIANDEDIDNQLRRALNNKLKEALDILKEEDQNNG